MPSYQPKIRNIKVPNKCSKCGVKNEEKDLFIIGIDESNYAITQTACRYPICRKCLGK